MNRDGVDRPAPSPNRGAQTRAPQTPRVPEFRWSPDAPEDDGTLQGDYLNAPWGERWPVVRTGEREPISSTVRGLVFERDGKRCRNCGNPLTVASMELDHIVPWSAGGSDRSENLRALCGPCNQDRSNVHGILDTRPRPAVSLSCTACRPPMTTDEWGEPIEVVMDLVPAYCRRCGVVSSADRSVTL